jgi:ACS family tartrate transporter-like MFS transporter
MITWGIFAGLTALVTGFHQFAVVRFLLGAAEAGFFPASCISPTGSAHHHGRIVSGFLIACRSRSPGGAPISTALLGLERVGPARLAMDTSPKQFPPS